MREYMSFGGGVQSTAIALLAVSRDKRLLKATGGKLPELYCFADTGDEPAAVYTNVEYMRGLIEESGADFKTVVWDHHKRGNQSLSSHIITAINEPIPEGKKTVGWTHPPFYVATSDGGSMPIRRSSTMDFKIKPQDKYMREYFGVIPRKRYKESFIRHWFGISCDEMQRERIAQEKWRTFYYPLFSMGWRRDHCMRYIQEHGMEVERSACTYCPFHSASEWQRIKTNAEEWKKVVEFERQEHEAYDNGKAMGLKTKPYLHPQRIPIDEVDFTGGQYSLDLGLQNECLGVCGV